MNQHKQALPEQQRQALIDHLDKTVAANPRYGGRTIGELVRQLAQAPKPKSRNHPTGDRDRGLRKFHLNT